MSNKVVVDEKVCTKPGTQVKKTSSVFVRGTPIAFVSKGGYKLERALQEFQLDVQGKVVLDAGASTGGFSDCLLQKGAAKVYSVDVGHGQLAAYLASDPKIVNMEKTNVGDLTPSTFNPPIDLCVMDLSYLSLTKAIPTIKSLFIKPVEIICLVKPLFEGLGQTQIGDLVATRSALENLFKILTIENNVGISHITVSPILGSRGTTEFLAHLTPRSGIDQPVREIADLAMAALAKNPPQDLDKSAVLKIQ